MKIRHPLLPYGIFLAFSFARTNHPIIKGLGMMNMITENNMAKHGFLLYLTALGSLPKRSAGYLKTIFLNGRGC